MQQETIMEVAVSLTFCAVMLVAVLTIYGEETVLQQTDRPGNFPRRKWICKENRCQKSNDANATTLTTCNMLCGDSPPLWPKPKQLDIKKKDSTGFLKQHIFLKIHSPDEVKPELQELANIFFDSLAQPTEEKYRLLNDEEQILNLRLHVRENNTKPSFSTNESYILYSQKLVDFLEVTIFAENYFGARNGLETLSQLIWFDTLVNKYRLLHDVKITDSPSFSHRGLLIDVSRHYFPLNLLKRAIDGMAASKLNVLHLHISDAASFPLVLPHNEELAVEGAYSDEETYTADDIKDLVKYARKRGVRIVMEVDAPSHVSSAGWPKEEILCDDSDMFKATLNPENPHSLETLKSVYADLIDLGADTETFHIGDDEVLTECWKNIETSSNLNEIWVNFTNTMMEKLKAANNGSFPKNIVLWSSPLTDRYLESLFNKKQLVVQYWYGKYQHILDKGYKIIFSTVGQWYLDCGFGPWRKSQVSGACDPYTDWRKFYKYRPWKDHSSRLDQVLGGEVCLWSEQVSPDDLETRLWPRTAAFAERVWSDPEVFEQEDVYRRIDFHSSRLKQRGLRVAAIWPEVCSQFPERC